MSVDLSSSCQANQFALTVGVMIYAICEQRFRDCCLLKKRRDGRRTEQNDALKLHKAPFARTRKAPFSPPSPSNEGSCSVKTSKFAQYWSALGAPGFWADWNRRLYCLCCDVSVNAGQPEEGCELPDAGASARRRRRLRSSLNKPNYRLPQLLPKSRAARQNRPCRPAATED